MGRADGRRWDRERLAPTANVVVALLSAIAALSVFQIFQLGTADPARDTSVPLDRFAPRINDSLGIGVSNGIVLVLTLGTIVAWCIWQYRAQADLYARGVPDLRYSPGWAVGWWFVPFASLVMPCLTMRELWRNAGRREGDISPLRSAWTVLAWWLVYAGAGVVLVIGWIPLIGSMIDSIEQQARGSSSQITSVTLSASAIHSMRLGLWVSDVLRVVAAAVGAWIVLAISRREDAAAGAYWPAFIPPRPDI
jgi:hypothetical protein